MIKELSTTKNVQDVIRVWSNYNTDEWTITDSEFYNYNKLVSTPNNDIDLRYVWTSATSRVEASLAVE